MDSVPLDSAGEPQNPSVPPTTRKCLRAVCQKEFAVRGPKLYCSRVCQKRAGERRRFKRNPQLEKAARHRHHLRYRAAHPEWAAACDRRAAQAQTNKRRGLTKEEFEARILGQGNRCPIGNHIFGPGRGRGYNNPCRDHNHTTEEWRAVICQRHNLALGLLRDDPAEAEAVAAYLKTYKPVTLFS